MKIENDDDTNGSGLKTTPKKDIKIENDDDSIGSQQKTTPNKDIKVENFTKYTRLASILSLLLISDNYSLLFLKSR